MKKILVLLSVLVLISSCMSGENKGDKQMVNPAAAFCVDNGGEYIVIEENGGTAGYCVFKDQSVCKGWDYFKSKCKPGDCTGDCKKGPRGEGYYDCKKKYYGEKPCLK